MEINKQDDYSGASSFVEFDDFSSLCFEEEEEIGDRYHDDDSFYRKLDEY